MNIIEMQDALKGYPDDLLAREVSQPSGNIPSYLAISELQRRKDMRDRFMAQQAPQSTVAEDLTMGIMGVANQGGMPSNPMMAPPPQPQPMTQEPVMRMSNGGITRGLEDLPDYQQERLRQLQEQINRIMRMFQSEEQADADPFAGADVNPFEMGVEGELPIHRGIDAAVKKAMKEKSAIEQTPLTDLPLAAETPVTQTPATGPMQGEFLKKLIDRYAGQDERARQNALLSFGSALMTSKSPTFLGALGEAGNVGIKSLAAGQSAGDKLLGELASIEAKAMPKKQGAKETIDSINALAKAAEATFNPDEKAQIFETIKQLRARLAQQLGIDSGSSGGPSGPSQDLAAEMRKRGLL